MVHCQVAYDDGRADYAALSSEGPIERLGSLKLG